MIELVYKFDEKSYCRCLKSESIAKVQFKFLESTNILCINCMCGVITSYLDNISLIIYFVFVVRENSLLGLTNLVFVNILRHRITQLTVTAISEQICILQ